MVTRAPVIAACAPAILASAACNAILEIDEHALSTSSEASSALGPPGCFRGTPSTHAEFNNRCTTSHYVRFDNCARLGLCGDEAWSLLEPRTDELAAAPDVATRPSLGCYDASSRNKLVFMQGSTNFTSFIQAMAPLVARNGYTIVWQPTSSCDGAGAGGFDARPGRNLMRNPTDPNDAYASFYDEDGVPTPCLLGNSPTAPDNNSELTDVGQSDVFASGCPLPSEQSEWLPGSAEYPNVGHYLGPIQAMVFVTPPGSSQRAISAEAARVVFGMGGRRDASPPWIDPKRMFMRSASTGTNNILSRAIGIPSDSWWGTDARSGSAMQSVILTTSVEHAEATIGILSIDYADRVKDSLHILAFQAHGQLAGFLPDSSPNASDKANVRDGHYAPWGPIHLYTKLIGGVPSAQATAFITPFTVPNRALIDAAIAGGTVPVCAMRVAREQEMGPLMPFKPEFACDCYYEAKANGGTDCKSCAGPADCPTSAPACNLGYCQED